MATLIVKRFERDAQLPTRATPGSAGFDLHAFEAATVPPCGSCLVDTGLGITVPAGTYGRIAPRSSLAVRGISVGAGVVDRDYRGRVKVLLLNHADATFEVLPGQRIAQLVLERIEDAAAVREVDELPSSSRDAGGFGSTGA